MDNKEPLIVFHPFNECLNSGCGGELIIVEKEVNVLRLNKLGMCRDNENIGLERSMVCLKCGREYEFKNVGMYYVKVFPNLINVESTRNPFGYTDK